jgi:hypothetical protein
MDRKNAKETENIELPRAARVRRSKVVTEDPPRKGGWREIEALREKAALKASLADVWDDDFDLDDEILAELDHTAEFFTSQEEAEEEIFDDDIVEDDEVDEFFEED